MKCWQLAINCFLKPYVRHKHYRGNNKCEETVFLTHNAEELSHFVAKDLTLLLALHINEVDVLHVSKAIKTLKDSVKELTSKQNKEGS